MANTAIQLKKSGQTGNTPVDLQHGEVAINYADGKLYYKDDVDSIQYISNQDTFNTINVGGSLILATSPTDILSVYSGNNISIGVDVGNKSLTINSTVNLDPVFTKANGAFDKANSASILAQQAFDKANTSDIISSGNVEIVADGNTFIFGTDGGLYIPGDLDVDGTATFSNAVFNGTVSIPGTINQVSGNSGVFYGQTANGFSALYAGYPSYTALPVTVFQSSGHYDGFIQNNFENTHPGSQASTEWVATSDNGTNLTGYIDTGIAGSGWDGTQEDSLGDAILPNDGWLYVMNDTGTSGGNLFLGAMSQGKKVKVITGTGASNVVAEFSSSNLTLHNSLVMTSGTIQTPYYTLPSTDGSNNQIIVTDGAGNLTWANVTQQTATYTANSITLTNGVYISGNVESIQTFGDTGSGGYFNFTDGTNTGPAWIVNTDFINVVDFNRIVLNISYTQNSGHTVYVQLYNYNTSTWDSFGSYNGLAGYYQFALEALSSVPYISGGNVQLRLYHNNTGNALHETFIDYIALEKSLQGPMGPKGSQGYQGVQGAVGSQGYQGVQGATGSQGAQGYQGYQGNIGEQGIEGTSGIIVGSSAPANTSVVWLDTTAPNQTGPQGYQGDTGSQGSQGYQGVQGATGSQGSQGYQGVQGATGSQGATGTQGYQGYQGYQGVSGVAPWSTSGSLVYYNSGNVSVGANTVISAISNNAKVLGICDNANSEIATIRLSSGPSFSSGNRMEVFAGAGSCGIYGQDAADMWFATNSVERVRINGGSGFVGIKEANPASPLTVRRDSVGGRGGEISIVNYATSTLNNSAALNFGLEGSTYHDDNGNAQIKAIITNAGTSAADLTFSTWDGSAFGERTRISSAGGWSVGTTANPGAGAIYATGNITAYYSDGRLKDVTGKIENALSKVEKLSGIYYKNNSLANSFGYTDNETQVGVIAQDVEKVLPEIVRPAPFDLDENNNSKSGENYKTIQYERIVPLLIEAIKELKLELDSLKGVK